ncbi:hypothetical protein ACLB2K_029131 [Fragaria x ananassa]
MRKFLITMMNLCSSSTFTKWGRVFNGKEFSKLCLDDLKDVYFPTVLEAEWFYYLYSRIVGFSVRRSRREMDENGRVIRRRWVCFKERKSPGQTGKKKGQDVKLQAKARDKRSRRGLMSRGVRYTRVGCPVEFAVRNCSEKGMYRVQWLRGARVHTSRTVEKLVEQAGGCDVVGFTVKDLYNKMDKLRKKSHTDGDAQAAMTWMNMRGIYSKLFYCRYSLDEEGRLANLFWRDHQSLLDYKAYSNVLIMDTTYKTNLYRKPLVNFLESMEDLQPGAILTNGDEAVRNVVEHLMPAARHRLCAWHIGRNIAQNVKDHAAQKSLGKMIYVSIRERWAEAFFRGHFYGGMCNTQRVEGMHSKLKLDLDRQKNSAPVFKTHMRGVEEEACRLFTYDIFIMIKSQILFEKQFVIVHRAPFPLTDTVLFYIAQYDRPHRRWSVEF